MTFAEFVKECQTLMRVNPEVADKTVMVWDTEVGESGGWVSDLNIDWDSNEHEVYFDVE